MPGSFREVLIFVAGSTPQIISESIYAFSQQNPPLYMDEIYVITTATGRQRIKDTLIDQGILAQLFAEYEIPPITLTDDSFLVIKDHNGHELDDIRTVADNEAAGDQIAQFLRRKSAGPHCRLHCLLSGGRKSMSYYMGISYQLFARQWDKLYHVMVSEDFEVNPHFFYKPKTNRKIEARLRNGEVKHLNTNDAEISLVELPLIFLRDKLSLSAGNVREMVAEGQKSIDSAAMQLPVRVDLAERTIYIGDTLIELQPVQLVLYTALLRHKLGPCKYGGRDYCQECTACFVPVAEMTSEPFLEAMGNDYQAIYGGDLLKREQQLEKWRKGLDAGNMRQMISRINGIIKQELDNETLYPFYQVACNRKYGGSRYGVRVEKGKIVIGATILYK